MPRLHLTRSPRLAETKLSRDKLSQCDGAGEMLDDRSSAFFSQPLLSPKCSCTVGRTVGRIPNSYTFVSALLGLDTS